MDMSLDNTFPASPDCFSSSLSKDSIYGGYSAWIFRHTLKTRLYFCTVMNKLLKSLYFFNIYICLKRKLDFLTKNSSYFLCCCWRKKIHILETACFSYNFLNLFCDKDLATSNLSFSLLLQHKITSQFPNFFFFLCATGLLFAWSTSEIASFKQNKSTASMFFKLTQSNFLFYTLWKY